MVSVHRWKRRRKRRERRESASLLSGLLSSTIPFFRLLFFVCVCVLLSFVSDDTVELVYISLAKHKAAFSKQRRSKGLEKGRMEGGGESENINGEKGTIPPFTLIGAHTEREREAASLVYLQ